MDSTVGSTVLIETKQGSYEGIIHTASRAHQRLTLDKGKDKYLWLNRPRSLFLIVDSNNIVLPVWLPVGVQSCCNAAASTELWKLCVFMLHSCDLPKRSIFCAISLCCLAGEFVPWNTKFRTTNRHTRPQNLRFLRLQSLWLYLVFEGRWYWQGHPALYICMKLP